VLGKPRTLRGRKNCLDLNQAQLLCFEHADHPSSACPLRPLQAHLALESTPGSSLNLRRTKVRVAIRLVVCYALTVADEQWSLPVAVWPAP
jgi:hypothetical protein